MGFRHPVHVLATFTQAGDVLGLECCSERLSAWSSNLGHCQNNVIRIQIVVLLWI